MINKLGTLLCLYVDVSTSKYTKQLWWRQWYWFTSTHLLLCPCVWACCSFSCGSMTDSYSDWAELCPIERGCVQLIEFTFEYFLSCRLSSGMLGCIHLRRRATVNLWLSPHSTFSVVVISSIALLWSLPVTENSPPLSHVTLKKTYRSIRWKDKRILLSNGLRVFQNTQSTSNVRIFLGSVLILADLHIIKGLFETWL